MKPDWQELFWSYPAATEPYSVEIWQEILDGLLDSFNRHVQLRFVHAEPPRLYQNENDLSIGFNVTCSTPSPLGALNLYGIGGIGVYETEDHKIGIGADISLFVFLNDARLKAESPDNTDRTDDYIAFCLVKDDGETKWECRNWECGFEGEWNGIEYSNKIATTNRLQVVLPDKDDERYDPHTERLELQACPCCDQDYTFPWMISANRELIWICRDCEAAWKKHEIFSRDNVIGFKWSEVEELPYQYTIEDVSKYGTFPPEASHIFFYSSNRFDVYECQMQPDCFEQFALARHLKTEPIKEPVWAKRETSLAMCDRVESIPKPRQSEKAIFDSFENSIEISPWADPDVPDNVDTLVAETEKTVEEYIVLCGNWNRAVKAEKCHCLAERFNSFREKMNDPFLDEFFEWTQKWIGRGYGMFLSF